MLYYLAMCIQGAERSFEIMFSSRLPGLKELVPELVGWDGHPVPNLQVLNLPSRHFQSTFGVRVAPISHAVGNEGIPV